MRSFGTLNTMNPTAMSTSKFNDQSDASNMGAAARNCASEELAIGGEGGIRTHVPSFPDHLISSQRRYDRFGTSPEGAQYNMMVERDT
jgi:hypothetical protein